MDQALFSLIVAFFGVAGVCIAAWIAATGALRVRLIDMQAQNEQERRAFHLRMVAAINDLNSVLSHFVHYRIEAVSGLLLAVHNYAEAKYPDPPGAGGWFAPDEATREVIRVNEQWNRTFAECIPFASATTGSILSAFDAQRSKVMHELSAALQKSDLHPMKAALETSQESVRKLQLVYSPRAYQSLEIDKLKSDADVFLTARALNIPRHAANEEAKLRKRIAQSLQNIEKSR